jgi:hypothetical protein
VVTSLLRRKDDANWRPDLHALSRGAQLAARVVDLEGVDIIRLLIGCQQDPATRVQSEIPGRLAPVGVWPISRSLPSSPMPNAAMLSCPRLEA